MTPKSQQSQASQQSQILEGSRAIALTIRNISPAVISAYPITPQTHIVEDLARFKADGEADFEYVRAESEFAAASIVLGASAAGSRVYTASSSQGLLLMAEVIYNIAGMRLPVVMTCANRAVSAPINIWNDQQDVMAVRDAGWILFFAENHQEAINQHIMAYKIAEKLKLPVMVNIDGFVLTHSYEPVIIPDSKQIEEYLPAYKPTKGEYLDPENPITMGAFASPAYYMEIRQQLHDDLIKSLDVIDKEFTKFQKHLSPTPLLIRRGARCEVIDNGLIEYYGPKSPQTILVAMGSVVGTIKEVIDESPLPQRMGGGGKGRGIGVLKIKVYRPFPANEILKVLKQTKNIAILDKSISLGHLGTLASDIKAVAQGKIKAKIQSFIVGLGGRDVTKKMVKKIIKEVEGKGEEMKFVGK